MIHRGSCHCGAVRIEVEAPEEVEVTECNCSICSRTGYLHLIVPKSAMRLVSGEDQLTLYTFNTGTAKHYFCRVCGCKPFYVPRSHPEGYSVNLRCLDPATIRSVTVRQFDGANWEAARGTLPPPAA
ncbi:MAG: GFA family protein [Pseudomonadota bacterium]